MKKYIYTLFFCVLSINFLFPSCADDDKILVPEYYPQPKPPLSGTDDNPRGDETFEAYNKAFLVSKDGLQYYRAQLNTDEKDYFWCQALDIQMAEDVYWRTKKETHAALIKNLLNAFIKQNMGTTPPGEWGWNDFNDDILWAGLAFARGYQITNEVIFLEKAEYAFNLMYDRGWDNELGGGIWWRMAPINDSEWSKSALSNSPAVILGCYLYEFTEDKSYLDKAIAIMDWELKTLYRPTDGGIYENINGISGKLSDYGNVYSNGTFVEAAAFVHKITGESKYYEAAQNAADYVKLYRTTNGIMARNNRDGTWQSEYLRGIGNFIRENNLWSPYYSWLRQNANVAWDNRREDLSLTWNDWLKETPPDNEMGAMESVGGVIVQQITPIISPELFQNTEYYIYSKSDTTKVMAISDGKINIKDKPEQISDDIKFRLVFKGYGYYQLEALSATGKVLAINKDEIVFETAVDNNNNQLWKIVFDNRGCHKFKPKASSLKCMVLEDSKLVLQKEKHIEKERWVFQKK